MATEFKNHTVEKIGGTSMSRLDELLEPLFQVGSPDYGRMFVVSAFAGITNALLEHKKSGEPGVYAHFAENTEEHGWMGALSKVDKLMREAHDGLLTHSADKSDANDFVRERVEGVRNCLIDLHRLCSYGHFRLSQHMSVTREMLSGLGEAHSAYVTTLLLRRNGVNARFVDLSGWRDDRVMDLDERIHDGLKDVDLDAEMPIITGYAQCAEGLMNKYDRGYSEVTFSQIASLTKAREAIIHKEFHLSSADPNLVGAENVRKLGHTNYDVADQLSNMGMEAIHPTAAKALRQAQVPLRVTNAFEPEDPGTLIDEAEAEQGVAEIVCGVDVFALELFEQDMVGVKGYDARILELLAQFDMRIVSKTSNANTITHYVDAPLSALRKTEKRLHESYPGSDVSVRSTAIVSVIGRDLRGLHVLERGLGALREAGIDVISAHQTTRTVDAQFVVNRDDRDTCVKILHDTFMGKGKEAPKLVA
ncbi:Bifunctional aspartokinase/homoserine dehydrogenase 1 [Roseivivax sp. THAF40]|uniref:aspartate kinase n=1 Tax=unclassified Roseivivax TaxID=2639302 RepID=UPI0012695E48|nr:MULTISPECIES: aspartate kinase [unclassified Roseivivax]QFS84236.1 Bifunctional aspartokinase/homoserine dehydrogenase 1 [Roseivivax sp. THAF197b]QFT48064.1 Bifunctional aspartokinase/homoserine dehydrogenase 1 [Roseivivax sp. THAF40]